MSDHLIKLLDRVIKLKDKDDREENLLKPHDAEDNTGWAMFLPTCYNQALDIQQVQRVTKGKKSLVWTQGSRFSFHTGDTIYDTPLAYMKWDTAMQHINYCIKVERAASASPATTNEPRYPGSVSYRLVVPDEKREKLVEAGEFDCTQDEFVRMLILGPKSDKKSGL